MNPESRSSFVIIICSLLFLLALSIGECCGAQPDQWAVTEVENQVPFTQYGDWVSFCVPHSTGYPVAIYLGPGQIVSSHYDASDVAKTVAKVEAPLAWREFVAKAAREGQVDCWRKEIPYLDPDYGACGEILPSFLAAMNLIMNETARALPYPPQIGQLVLPRNLFGYWDIVDYMTHRMFNCSRDDQRGDYSSYDIANHMRAAQYGYGLITPDDLGISWAPDGRKLWDDPEFREIYHGDIFANPDHYILLANIERDFLELSPFCVAMEGFIPMKWDLIMNLGEDSLHFGQENRPFVDGWPDIRATVNHGLGQARKKLAEGISSYMSRNSFPLQRELLAAVIVTGGAPKTATDALSLALRDALPHLNNTRFKDSLDPTAVFSLGAAVPGRNHRLWQEVRDCYCDVPERLRVPEGLPSDNEFPCNRSRIRGPVM